MVTNYKVNLKILFPPGCVTGGNNEKHRVTTSNNKLDENLKE